MEVELIPKKEPMTKKAAQRIQSHADKTGKDQDFKVRAQRSADKNEEEEFLLE